jgi:DNA segregation ATPase FtsK/SpoIIIE-like protein
MQRLIYFLSLLVRKVALILIWIFQRDTLFREAAEIIVNAQTSSASLLQRKLKLLGYNRPID